MPMLTCYQQDYIKLHAVVIISKMKYVYIRGNITEVIAFTVAAVLVQGCKNTPDDKQSLGCDLAWQEPTKM